MIATIKPSSARTQDVPGPLPGHPENTLNVFVPTNDKVTRRNGKRPLVLWCHGAGGTAVNSLFPQDSYIIGILNTLGFVVIAGDWGDPTIANGPTSSNGWANSNVTASLESARVWAASNVPNVDTTAVVLFGESMGTTYPLGYARDFPSRFLAGVTMVSFPDMAWCRANRGTGANGILAPSIDAAWGLLSTDPTPAAADFANMASLVNTAPMLMYYKPDDPVAVPSVTIAMAAQLGGRSKAVSAGTGNAVTDGGTTNGSNIVTSAGARIQDQGGVIAGAGIPAATVISVNPGVSWAIGSGWNAPQIPVNATATASNVAVTVSAGHDTDAWLSVRIEDMVAWLEPLVFT